MADAAVRDEILARRNARHTEDLRLERDATRLEVEIDRARRDVERAEELLDRKLLILRALEASRKPEGT